jgi:uncharacterized protein YbaP (TraB family)
MRFVVRLLTLFTLLIPGGAAAIGREPMWVVEKAGSRVYLVGSMHVLPRSVSPARPALIRAFNDSQRVYFEIATIADANPKVEKFFKQYGTYKEPDNLQKHLTTDAKDMVALVLPIFSLRWQDVQNHKPWLLGMRLQQSLLRSPGFAASKGVDEYFESLARKKGKPIAGLETPQQQLEFFASMSDAEQSAALVNDIEGLVWLRQDLEAMGRMWKLGTVDLFEQGLAAQQSSKLGKRLFRDRNLRWLPQVVRQIESRENAMIIVGMGHLVGKDGLVQLLRARGYAVRQM